MTLPTVTVAIPSVLRRLLAARASEQGVTQDALANAMIRIALATAEQAAGDDLVRYLTDPRLEGTSGGSPTMHIERELNDRAAALAARLTVMVGRSVAKGRVMQALLWAELEPLAPDVPRIQLPTASSVDTVTVAVPAALNSALLDLALKLQTSREVLVDDLMAATITAVERDPTLVNTLAHDQRTQPGDGRGKTTIRVGRTHDADVRQLADQAFGSVKSYAVQALLWYGIDQAESTPAVPPPDRPVLLDGPLYARVARLALDLKEERGRVVPIREFVQQAVEQAVSREERRRGRTA